MFELIPKSHDFGIAREKKQGGIIALSKWSQIQPRGREVSHLYFPLHGLREIRFRSLEAGVQLLSAKNRALLRLIAARRPKSVSELAMLAGRAEQNVLRTLRKLSAAGLVRLDKGDGRAYQPVVAGRKVHFEIDLLT
jgi:DNA-binding transcriptional ArsR family regulator